VAGQLRFILADEAGARRVGLAYLSQSPEERDRQVLVDLLIAGVVWPSLAGADVRTLIDARVRRDFASGDVVQLQGWMLSHTEARLCALAALDASA
jgi:hypothetical protein